MCQNDKTAGYTKIKSISAGIAAQVSRFQNYHHHFIRDCRQLPRRLQYNTVILTIPDADMMIGRAVRIVCFIRPSQILAEGQ